VNAQENHTPAAGQIESVADFLDNSPEALGAVVNQAKKSAEQYLAQKGWHLGQNTDGRFVTIGAGPITGEPTDKDFQTKRGIGFERAMLNAKEEIATYYSQAMQKKVLSSYEEISQVARELTARVAAQNNNNASLPAKLEMLLHAKINRQLEQEGVPVNSPSAAKRAGELLNSDQFSRLITRSSKAVVSGLICSKMFEENGQIAVVAYYSPATRALGAALAGRGAAPSAAPAKETLKVWVKSLTPLDLYPSIGVQLASDENGNIVILSYAQRALQTNSKLALRNAQTGAKTEADGYIAQFAGEQVAFDNVGNTLEMTEEFDDGVVDSMAGEVSKTNITAVTERLKISGIETWHDWQTLDKRSGKYIVGTVRAWSLTSSNTAKATAAAAGTISPAKNTPSAGGPAKPYKDEGLESQDF
jgi:hypothetical protein